MKRLFTCSIAFSLTILLLSCSHIHEKRLLSIVLPADFNYDIIEKVYLTNGEDVVDSRESYDTITKMLNYQYDSIPDGNYILQIKTIFDQLLNYPIVLSSDTTIHINNPYGKNELISKEKFAAADTIELVFISNGCFHHYFEKSILTRTTGAYHLKTSSNSMMQDVVPLRIQKKVSKGIVDSLFLFESELKKAEEQAGANGLYYFSTTTKLLFFKCGNNVFQINEPFWQNEGLYDKFKSAYILTNTDTLQ